MAGAHGAGPNGAHGGPSAPRDASSGARSILVTGGAGFVGSNLVAQLLAERDTRVTVLDNLHRRGVEHNAAWLKKVAAPGQLRVLAGDVRDAAAVYEAARDADEIYHLAAQVAVTTSVEDPRADFETNLLGTLNVLEAARAHGRRPFLFFTSTNKVYGGLHSVQVVEDGRHYRAADPGFCGAGEDTPLDFHSPYGCSKGAADQYVRDYARIYDLPTVVFRMSCIAGPRQFGNEDQGWVAHFLYSVLAARPITIYGNGLQVRDILHVHDLVDAILAARAQQAAVAGEIFNLGGGLERSASVLEMLAQIEQLTGIAPRLSFGEVRPGDQPLYISNTRKLTEATGWQPQRSLAQIVGDIYEFWRGHRELITSLRASLDTQPSELHTDALVENEVA